MFSMILNPLLVSGMRKNIRLAFYVHAVKPQGHSGSRHYCDKISVPFWFQLGSSSGVWVISNVKQYMSICFQPERHRTWARESLDGDKYPEHWHICVRESDTNFFVTLCVM